MPEFREPQPRDNWIALAWIGFASGSILTVAFLSGHLWIGTVPVVGAIVFLLLLRWMSRAWGYRCPQCGELFQLSMPGQFTAINMGEERSIRCPHCGRRSWMKVLRKVD